MAFHTAIVIRGINPQNQHGQLKNLFGPEACWK